MGRVEKDFQALVITTMNDIRNICATHDVVNDIDARNRLLTSVNFLEDIISPYFNDYHPVDTGDPLTDIHVRIRKIMNEARKAYVITPRTISIDLEDEIEEIPD